MTQTHQARPRLLATAVLAALMLPGAAFAQTAKERELEARVAQLEQMVQQLVAQQQPVSYTHLTLPTNREV